MSQSETQLNSLSDSRSIDIVTPQGEAEITADFVELVDNLLLTHDMYVESYAGLTPEEQDEFEYFFADLPMIINYQDGTALSITIGSHTDDKTEYAKTTRTVVVRPLDVQGEFSEFYTYSFLENERALTCDHTFKEDRYGDSPQDFADRLMNSIRERGVETSQDFRDYFAGEFVLPDHIAKEAENKKQFEADMGLKGRTVGRKELAQLSTLLYAAGPTLYN